MSNQSPPFEASDSHTNDDTLKLALEVAKLGFWDHNVATGATFRSVEWAEMLGYTTDEVEENLRFWLDHIHPDDLPAVKREIHAHENEGKPAFEIEHRMRTKDGQWKWILNWGRVIKRGEDGKPLRALGFHLDITERKYTERAMARANKLSTIGTLAGGIAHDFNNLLTIIQGNLQLAQDTDANSRKKFLGNAERAVKRSQDLTSKLLTFASGGTPTIEPVDIEQVIIGARDLVLSGASSRVKLESKPGLDLVAGSEGQLAQVFQNIFLNSCQAMPDGGIISVTCQSCTLETSIQDWLSEGQYIEVIIADQGPGIPEELASQVFDPFFTTKPEGQGFGLATAHSIISDHQGMLELLPAAGGGATFRILLPVAGENDVPQSERNIPQSSSLKGKILVVDDDEMVRDIAVEVIRRLGYESITADDGALAIDLYKQAQQDNSPILAVIMDLTIPGGTGGKEATARILELDPAARVIVSSGYSDDPVMAQYREYGFKAQLAKPYELSEMRKVLLGVLAKD